ncbi:MAG: hypothetical protein CM1200mP36_08300 [Gammaproteobacteria bacterium]|nr:MAG: hypothetical protein CM1200mP36_08300 [Gammaproteobacteria bacterium]
MQSADPDSVLGDFSNAQFNYNDVTSEFFTRDESYWVRTDGPNGELMEYEVTHTFGVEPLQQYLTRFPNGRLPSIEHRVGLTTSGAGRPALVSSLPWRHHRLRGPAPLDRYFSELEQQLRRMPFHESAEELFSGRRPLRDEFL